MYLDKMLGKESHYDIWISKGINSPTPLYTDGDPARSPQSFLGYHWAYHNGGPRRVFPFGPHMRLRLGCIYTSQQITTDPGYPGDYS